MDCWICKDLGNTGEHKTKASDLRAVFVDVSQDHPIYLHTDEKRNQKIGSVKSYRLKSSAKICATCNNSRTAKNDQAWERMSAYLRQKRPALANGDFVSFKDVFPKNPKEAMLSVHLFFSKQFGCAIGEGDVPIERDSIAQAILQQVAHPKIYLVFGVNQEQRVKAARSDMHVAMLEGKCAFATWLYVVGCISVNVIFSEPGESRRGLRNAWHPRLDTDSLLIDSCVDA